jgi:membrane-bound serine protease (ClpP class)
MSLIFLLFVAGVILIALEVVVPGGVLGILGGISILAGVLLSFDRFGAEGGAVATGIGLALGAVALYLEFVLLPRSRLARTFSMTATVAGKSQPDIAARDVIGKRVVAVTPLAPSGVVELDGRRYEAFARSGHAPVGAALEIVGLDNFRLIVINPSNHHTS